MGCCSLPLRPLVLTELWQENGSGTYTANKMMQIFICTWEHFEVRNSFDTGELDLTMVKKSTAWVSCHGHWEWSGTTQFTNLTSLSTSPYEEAKPNTGQNKKHFLLWEKEVVMQLQVVYNRFWMKSYTCKLFTKSWTSYQNAFWLNC